MSSFCFGSKKPLASKEELFDAIRDKSLSKTKEALNCHNVNARDEYGFTPLHNAIKLQYLEMVSLLLNNGADVNAMNERGCTPLNIAISKFNLEIILVLLDRGASINAKDENGFTPLHRAVNLKLEPIARLLLDRGANPNAKDENGFTPLHIAVNRHATELALTLLERGAEVNAQNNINWTPLHESINQSKFDLAYLLLDKGADINAVNDKGNTPLNWFHQRSWNANPNLVISLIPESPKLNTWDHCNLKHFLRITLGASYNDDDQFLELISQNDFESFLNKALIFRLTNVANNEVTEAVLILNILRKISRLTKDNMDQVLVYFNNHLNRVCRALSAIYPVLKDRIVVVNEIDEGELSLYNYMNEVNAFFLNKRVKLNVSDMLCRKLKGEIYRRIFGDSWLPVEGIKEGHFNQLPIELWFKIFEMALGPVLYKELSRYDYFISLILGSHIDCDEIVQQFATSFNIWLNARDLFDVNLSLPGDNPKPFYIKANCN